MNSLEYIKTHIMVYSGNAYRLTVPNQILSFWNKTGEEKIPLCFFLVDGKVRLDPLEEVLKNSSYPEEVLERVKEDWSEILLKMDMYQRRLLLKEYIKGNYSEREYRLFLEKHFEKYHKITRQMRKTLETRGLTFAEIESVTDIVELELLVLESEKEEKLSEMLTEVDTMRNEVQHLKELLRELDDKTQKGLVAADIAKLSKKDLEKELMLATRRLEKLKEHIAKL